MATIRARKPSDGTARYTAIVCMDCIRPLVAAIMAIAVGLFANGCGGGGGATGGTTAAVTQVSVSLAPTIATVQESSTANLTAMVAGDARNLGVKWSVTCQTGTCGTVAPGNTTSGESAIYRAPATMHSNMPVTVTATSVSDPSKIALATLIPVGHIAGYDVGVDYHSYGTSYDQTTFITTYDQPNVRAAVQAQVQGMADRGATFLHTSIWFVTYPGTTNFGQTWRATFPMTDQEAANLRAYAHDVAAIQGAGGSRLRLDIALEWLGASDYTIGSPTTGLGYNKDLSATEFI
jgi:hypothetical protein